jgi:hypothetical protein
MTPTLRKRAEQAWLESKRRSDAGRLDQIDAIADAIRAALEERDGVWRSAVNRHDACGICDVDDEEPCTACAPLRALMKEPEKQP